MSRQEILAPVFDPAEWKKIPTVTTGLPASPGAASGQVVFTDLPKGETQVTVTLMVVPQGTLAGLAAGLYGRLDETLEEDLRSFKAYAEAGQPAAVSER